MTQDWTITAGTEYKDFPTAWQRTANPREFYLFFFSTTQQVLATLFPLSTFTKPNNFTPEQMEVGYYYTPPNSESEVIWIPQIPQHFPSVLFPADGDYTVLNPTQIQLQSSWQTNATTYTLDENSPSSVMGTYKSPDFARPPPFQNNYMNGTQPTAFRRTTNFHPVPPDDGALLSRSTRDPNLWVYRVPIDLESVQESNTKIAEMIRGTINAQNPQAAVKAGETHYRFDSTTGPGSKLNSTFYAHPLPICDFDEKLDTFVFQATQNFAIVCYTTEDAAVHGLEPGEAAADALNLRTGIFGNTATRGPNTNNLIPTYGYYDLSSETPPPAATIAYTLASTVKPPPDPPPPPPDPPVPLPKGDYITIVNSTDPRLNPDGWWRIMRDEIGMTPANFLFGIPLIGAPVLERTPNCVDLRAGLHSLHLRSNLTTTAAIDSQSNNYSSVLCRLPVNDALPGGVIYANHGGHQSLVKTKSLKHVVLSLCDDRNRLLDLNGLHWQVAMTFHFVYSKKAVPELSKIGRRLMLEDMKKKNSNNQTTIRRRIKTTSKDIKQT
jgi:hypothetical protein